MITKFLLAGVASLVALGVAHAADLPRRQAPPPVFVPVPVFTWTGFYLGTHSSYTFSDNQTIRTQGNDALTSLNVQRGRRADVFKADQDGIGNIGGGIGYNYQFTPGSGFVVGAEADVTWTDIGKRRDFFSAPSVFNGGVPDQSTYRNRLNYLGTVQGRLGYAFDRFLVYGTGGFAYGDVKYQSDFFLPAGLAYTGRYKGFETGYVYGGGIEYAIPTDSFLNRFNFIGGLIGASAITLKAEYLRYDLGSRNVLINTTGIGPGGSYTSRFNTEGNLIKAGFNYKFGTL